jgi:uncharacterized protein with HEPN domain
MQYDMVQIVRQLVNRLVRFASRERKRGRLSRAAFFASPMIQDAVLRNLEVVGEAVKGLDDSSRSLAPDVPWRRIAGMRDVLIHHYFGVDLEVIWQVVEDEVPSLVVVTKRLIEQLTAK